MARRSGQLVFFLAFCILQPAPGAVGQGSPEILAVTPVGESPVAVAINPSSNQAFVVNQGSRTVAVLDMKSHQVTARYSLGGNPVSIAANARTNRVVVAGLDGIVSVIDPASGEIVASIPAGKAPSRIAVDSAKNTALVTNFNGGNMAVIDLAARKVVSTVELGNGPLGIALLEEKRRAIIACQYDMELRSVNLDTGVVENHLLVGRYLSEIAANEETGQVVVGNPSANGIISIYDPMSNRLVATQPVGAGPLSIAVYAKRNVALVSAYNDGTVTLLDMKLGLPLKTVRVGKGPLGIAVHPQTGIAVVVNKTDGTAVFLDVEAALKSIQLP
jgi:YVTN family beta-propeller protein